jgi:uncharacterized repeat protein (TIGR01451 family)
MRTRSTRILVAAAVLGAATTAQAAPALRVQVDQHGDFLMIGNTLGYECDVGTPPPVVGTIAANACAQLAANITDTAPDVFWRSDAPGVGMAVADINTLPAQARSTAVLTVPVGATVTHAYLYWAAEMPAGGTPTTQVTVDRGATFTQSVTAVQTFNPGVNAAYQSVANVTALVQQYGSGAYRVSGINPTTFVNVNDNAGFAGWALVVFYQRAADPLRNLAIFDGLDIVSNGNNQSATLTGFLVPNAGFTGKLGVIAYEGDNLIPGDQLFFNGGTALSDAQNPITNFFNGTRSNLGAAVSVVGDLPQLTGTAQSMAGMDLDIVDVTAKLTAGQTSAPVQATSTGDVYYLGAFITSVSTFKPDFTTSTKTGSDINGGSLLAGDKLQYTINVINTGNDASVNTVMSDPLPMGVTYVPGSITLNGTAKTDAAGDDQADYNAATRTVTARLGTGATATLGGTLAINATSTIAFQVTVNAGFTGNLANQANITAAGQLGSPSATTPTDGNGPAVGSPPTTVVVDECATSADCPAMKPACDVTTSPKTCVQCVVDGDCGGAMSGKVCDVTAHACIDGCRGAGGNGCATPAVCTSMDATIGQCVECLVDVTCGGALSGKVCDAATDKCVDGCRGMGGNGCPTGDECTSMDASIGQCVACLSDADCGGVMSGKVCDVAAHTCGDGCRGMGGNGCPTNAHCTSMDTSVGQCVACLQDTDCGGNGSGKVCDATTDTCVDGCRGTSEGICPTGQSCTSMDQTIGKCVACLTDAECGGAMSGKVCDLTTDQCVDGCRGTGNGCPTGKACTSTNATIGQCVACLTDADCGDASSGKVCDLTTDTCVPGCRGAGGNGCPAGQQCSSSDTTIGTCAQCQTDGDCGSATSGMVCDDTTLVCRGGCRGSGGNGCPDGQQCSSTDSTIGACGGTGGTGGMDADGVVPEGNGILCAARPRSTGSGDEGGWMWMAAAAAVAAMRRRRR